MRLYLLGFEANDSIIDGIFQNRQRRTSDDRNSQGKRSSNNAERLKSPVVSSEGHDEWETASETSNREIATRDERCVFFKYVRQLTQTAEFCYCLLSIYSQSQSSDTIKKLGFCVNCPGFNARGSRTVWQVATIF